MNKATIIIFYCAIVVVLTSSIKNRGPSPMAIQPLIETKTSLAPSASSDYESLTDDDICEFSGTVVYISLTRDENWYMQASDDSNEFGHFVHLSMQSFEYVEQHHEFKWTMICTDSSTKQIYLENVKYPSYVLNYLSNLNNGVMASLATLGTIGMNKSFRWSLSNLIWDKTRCSFAAVLKNFHNPDLNLNSYYDTSSNGGLYSSRKWYDRYITLQMANQDYSDKSIFYIKVAKISNKYSEIARITTLPGITGTYQISIQEGISNTRSEKHEIEDTMTYEIKAAYKGSGVKVSKIMKETWGTASDSTFSKSITETITLNINEPGTYVVTQLVGLYNNYWQVNSNIWKVDKLLS